MSLRFLGKKRLAAAIPMLADLAAAFDLPTLQGQALALTGLILNFKPPSVAGIKLGLGAITAALPKFELPDVSLMLPDLIFRLGLLKAQIALLIQIADLLLAAGVHVYSYSGNADGMGGTLTAEFSPGPSQGGIVGSSQLYSILLVVEGTATATVTATKTIFGDL